nr:MAG TPA: hypothetical protein [Caudoviricetes sp.]
MFIRVSILNRSFNQLKVIKRVIIYVSCYSFQS